MRKSLNIIKYLALGGIFLTPFVVLSVSGSMFFPFITGKNFTFRILVEAISMLWMILMIFDARYKPKNSLISATLAIFVIILALSSIFGENFYRSFWSNYERMEGLVTYLHLFAFFLVLVLIWGVFKKIFKLMFYAGIIISLLLAANLYFIYQDFRDLRENFSISEKKVILKDGDETLTGLLLSEETSLMTAKQLSDYSREKQ